MKKQFWILLILSLFVMQISYGEQTTKTVELTAVKDVWLEGSSNNNYYNFLIVGAQTPYPKKRSLLAFDLSSIPPGSKINKATLQIYHIYCHGSGTVPAININVHQVLKSWDENQATSYKRNSVDLWDSQYLNFGTDAKSTADSVVNIGTTNDFKYFDLTSLAQRWTNGEPNYGILLWTSNEDTGPCDRRFYSREYTEDTSKVPKLIVNYTTGTPACSIDSDCGTDSFTGNYFCDSGDVYRNKITYSCIDPGIFSSYCSSSIIPVLVDECSASEQCVAGSFTCQQTSPTISKVELTAIKDVWLEGSSNNNDNDFFIIGVQSGYSKKRSLLEFDLSTIPSNAVITSAVMQIYHNYCHGNGPAPAIDVQAHQVLKSWDENYATSNKRTSTENWDSQYLNLGTDAKSTPDSVVNIGTTNDMKYLDVTSLTQKWVSGAEDNYGLLLWTPNENTGPCDRRFHSREYSDQSKRPKMVVNYFEADCTANLDCGTETERYYCKDGDVYANTTSYICNNPSTVDSYCSHSSTSMLFDDCGAGEQCFEGMDTCQDSASSVHIELTPSKDVWIEGSTNTNAYDFLIIGRQTGYEKKRSLLEFNVSCIPSTALIADSSLNMYHIYCHGSGTIPSIDIRTHQVLKSWDESYATSSKRTSTENWDSQYINIGTDAKSAAESTVNIGTSNGWKMFDVTSLTRKWVKGEETNNGLLLWTPNEEVGPCDRRFYSRESSDYSMRPRLSIIVYANETFFTTLFYLDEDGDQYGVPGVVVEECSPPYGYASNGADCDDSNSQVNPGSVEVCNNLDEDCDYLIDENITRPYYTGPPGTQGIGLCNAGTESCGAGSWYILEPEVTPTAETCNNLDEDCDYLVDENLTRPYYTGPPGTEGIGLCRAGTESCGVGAWNVTEPEVTPITEILDDLDNDCDSFTDEYLCGNEILDFGEYCDDGNIVNGDGCNGTCYSESIMPDFDDYSVEDNGDGTYNYTFSDDSIPHIQIGDNEGLIDMINTTFDYGEAGNQIWVSVGNLTLNGTTKRITIRYNANLCVVDKPYLFGGSPTGSPECFTNPDRIVWRQTSGNRCNQEGVHVVGKDRFGVNVPNYTCVRVVYGGINYAEIHGLHYTFVVSIADLDNDEYDEDDCDDEDPLVNPGAEEVCDSKDNNCDGRVDDGCPITIKQSSITLLENAKEEGQSCDKLTKKDKLQCETNRKQVERTNKLLDKVIESIKASLKQKYWEDELRLNTHNGRNNGRNVFKYESKAVLLCPTREKGDHELSQVCAQVEDNLVEADLLIAQTTINDAESTEVQNKANQRCYDAMLKVANRAMETAAKKDKQPAVAITNYMRAWNFGEKAIVYAESSKDICRRLGLKNMDRINMDDGEGLDSTNVEDYFDNAFDNDMKWVD